MTGIIDGGGHVSVSVAPPSSALAGRVAVGLWDGHTDEEVLLLITAPTFLDLVDGMEEAEAAVLRWCALHARAGQSLSELQVHADTVVDLRRCDLGDSVVYVTGLQDFRTGKAAVRLSFWDTAEEGEERQTLLLSITAFLQVVHWLRHAAVTVEAAGPV